MDLIEHNREAWNRLSERGILWSQPVEPAVISEARLGTWEISLAGCAIPKSWLGDVTGKDVLCLAAGGGQQAPILAAAGAEVTCLDISEVQLGKDALVAERDDLAIRLEQGTVTDLSRFAADSFDVITMPVSLNAIPDVQPVWKECFRVLRPGGTLLAGFINPAVYLFEENDGSSPDAGLSVVNCIPYSEYEAMSDEERHHAIQQKSVFLWSHTLETLLGGQLRAGFVMTGFLESRRNDRRAPNLDKFCPTYFTTRARKSAIE